MKFLTLAYFYPPDGASGSLRNGKQIAGLLQQGAEVDVIGLSAEHSGQADYHDTVPAGLSVTRTDCKYPVKSLLAMRSRMRPNNETGQKNTSAGNVTISRPARKSLFGRLKDFITDALETPDKEAFWYFYAVRAAMRLPAARDADVIYAIGKPWVALLAGAALKRKLKKPLIIDFMDPWISNPYGDSKGRLLDALERWMEKRAVSAADLLIANTPELEQDFIARYPFLKGRTGVVGCGYLAEDFAGVQPYTPQPGVLRIAHVGSLYARRDPSRFLAAIEELITDGEIDKDSIRVSFVGGLNIESESLRQHVDHLVAMDVLVLEGWKQHQEALDIINAADVALIIQPETLLQIPAKLYEYVYLRKPMLAVAERQGAIDGILSRHGWGSVIEDDTAAIKQELLAMYQRFHAGEALAEFTDEAIARYGYPALAQKLIDYATALTRRQEN